MVMRAVGRATRLSGRTDQEYHSPVDESNEGWAALQKLKRRLASSGRFKPNGKRR
jgi:hypothetical protein